MFVNQLAYLIYNFLAGYKALWYQINTDKVDGMNLIFNRKYIKLVKLMQNNHHY